MSDKKSFIHPELREDEVYLGNFSTDFVGQTSYRSWRFGNTSYDINGRRLEGLSKLPQILPVFVSKEEYRLQDQLPVKIRPLK